MYLFYNSFCSTQRIYDLFGFINTFSDVLTVFTCAEATGNLWSICLGVNIFNLFACDGFNGDILLLKALRVNSRRS